MTLARRIASLKDQIEAMPGAVAQPRPKVGVTLFKVKNKMFAILAERGEACVVLKCDPVLADTLRAQYEGIGHRGHLDRRFWIAVALEGDVPARELKKLVAHSYDLVVATLTRKQQAELAALSD